jgi:hypothetical protein
MSSGKTWKKRQSTGVWNVAKSSVRRIYNRHPLPDSNRRHKILSKSTFSPFYLTFPLCLDILFTVKSKGKTVTKKCPKCQMDNPDTLKFCGECGTQLLSAEDFAVTKTIEAPREELTTGSTFAGRYRLSL